MRDCTPVGAVRGSLYLPSGYVLADGATVDRADYPRLVRLADINNLWTNDPTNNEGLFGVGDGSTTMVLPNWVDKFEQYANTAGASVEAGLPNIKGATQYNFSQMGRGHVDTDGAISVYDNPNNRNASTGSSAGYATIDFDASRYNSIYSDSVTTVQPPANKLLPILRY